MTYVRNASAGDMRRLMRWADAAVTSPSSTCWELAYMGVPAAVLAYSENQRGLGPRLRKAGVALDLGWHDRTSDAALARKLAALLHAPKALSRMSLRGRMLVDGRGVERVRRAMGL